MADVMYLNCNRECRNIGTAFDPHSMYMQMPYQQHLACFKLLAECMHDFVYGQTSKLLAILIIPVGAYTANKKVMIFAWPTFLFFALVSIALVLVNYLNVVQATNRQTSTDVT